MRVDLRLSNRVDFRHAEYQDIRKSGITPTLGHISPWIGHCDACPHTTVGHAQPQLLPNTNFTGIRCTLGSSHGMPSHSASSFAARRPIAPNG